jgi:nitrogen fixation NifU-like protein
VDALYQKQILAYAHKSRSSLSVDQPTHSATLDNTTCGDRVDVTLEMAAGHIEKIGMSVRGCALCEAGAGLALDCLPGRNETEIRDLTEGFAIWIDGKTEQPPLPDMQHFMPVREIRNRHKCVLLAFQATVSAVPVK